MKFQKRQPRYLLNTIHCSSLEPNPLHSPIDRTVSIYLPPNYYKNSNERFPVVYLLHGYDGHAGNWIMMPDLDLISWQPVKLLMKSIGNGLNIEYIPTYSLLEQLIKSKHLPQMIIVQPDASLHLHVRGGLKGLDGSRATKGSFYINSPFTGKYADYITQDVIQYIDHNFRTIPNRENRAIVGGSMGGYGALYLGIQNSDLFSAIGALSPANVLLDHFKWKLVVPIIAKLLGNRLAQKFGDSMFHDILETQDLIYSGNRPLIPTLKFDKTNKLVDFDKEAFENWKHFDLNRIFRTYISSKKHQEIWMSCDSSDEYGLYPVVEQMRKTLEELSWTPRFEGGHDPRTELSPHIFGIAFQLMPALKFCTAKFQQN